MRAFLLVGLWFSLLVVFSLPNRQSTALCAFVTRDGSSFVTTCNGKRCPGKNKKEIESGRQVPKTEANPLHQPKAPKMHPRLLEGQSVPSHLAGRSVRGSPTSPSVAPRQSPCADVASGGPRQSPCPGGVVTNPAGATSTPVRVVAQTLPIRQPPGPLTSASRASLSGMCLPPLDHLGDFTGALVSERLQARDKVGSRVQTSS